MGAHAQTQTAAYPSKPVRIVVAFTAGGSTDVIARGLGQQLAGKLKPPFVIDNKPGARRRMLLGWLVPRIARTDHDRAPGPRRQKARRAGFLARLHRPARREQVPVAAGKTGVALV